MSLFTNVGGQWILKSIDMLNATISKSNAIIVTTEVTITEVVMVSFGPSRQRRKAISAEQEQNQTSGLRCRLLVFALCCCRSICFKDV